MAYIKKEIIVEVKIGDEVYAPWTDYGLGTSLYVCHIDGDMLYINPNKNASREECEKHNAENCELI